MDLWWRVGREVPVSIYINYSAPITVINLLKVKLDNQRVRLLVTTWASEAGTGMTHIGAFIPLMQRNGRTAGHPQTSALPPCPLPPWASCLSWVENQRSHGKVDISGLEKQARLQNTGKAAGELAEGRSLQDPITGNEVANLGGPGGGGWPAFPIRLRGPRAYNSPPD